MPTLITQEIRKNFFALTAMKSIGGIEMGAEPIADQKCKCGNTIKAYKTFCKSAFSNPTDIYIMPRTCDKCKNYKSRKLKKDLKSGMDEIKKNKHYGFIGQIFYEGKNKISVATQKQYEDQKKLMDKIVEFMVEKKKGIFVFGRPGTGKTFNFKLINNALVEDKKNVMFIPMTELASLLRGLVESKDWGILNRIKNVDYLIIDDFGSQKNSEYLSQQVFDIIDSRYTSRKPTFINSNLALNSIANENPRIASRIADTDWMTSIKLSGKDRRIYKK